MSGSDAERDVPPAAARIASARVDRHVRRAGKVRFDDLDWSAARRAGLNDAEAFVVTYFADIESQTPANLRMLLSMKGALDPELAAFLTTWNYEEFFHGYALSRLLSECGRALPDARHAAVRDGAGLKERSERVLLPLLSHLLAREFPAVYMTFGALHELTTLRGYEALQARAHNPLLRVLSARIARQERRHFAFYFGQARDRLARSAGARRLTRALRRFYWAPVGAGVKGREQVEQLFQTLFPGAFGPALCAEVDAKIGALPGLAGVQPMAHYFALPAAGAHAGAGAGRSG
jgi:rubrerythrin